MYITPLIDIFPVHRIAIHLIIFYLLTGQNMLNQSELLAMLVTVRTTVSPLERHYNHVYPTAIKPEGEYGINRHVSQR